ncbi:MAG: DUF3109 family protein [Ignavibacteria bacterium]|nr:DUF3109 family protein [Ignavibacteria bacterium]
MIVLENILLQQQVLTTHFACDLKGCKGACCTMKGGAGAPLREDEVRQIQDVVPTVLHYLPERSQQKLAIDVVVEGPEGDRTVACIDDADCVFVHYEGSIAKCAIEKAFFNGEIDFRKPLSCHLFPIRVANFGGPYLHYEVIDECAPGRALGEQLGRPLVESLREPLIRAYGEQMYEQILTASRDDLGGQQ